MSNRPLTQYTKLAVGSLIPGVAFQVRDEETYSNIQPAYANSIINSIEVNGAHNVAQDTANPDGTRTLVLHQIRIKNSSDAGLRPSWGSVDAAEISVSGDEALATAKRDAIYADFSSGVAGMIGTMLNSLNVVDLNSLQVFERYMGGKGVTVNARGRIVSVSPSTKAPAEKHFNADVDDDGWLVVNVNAQWADFIS